MDGIFRGKTAAVPIPAGTNRPGGFAAIPGPARAGMMLLLVLALVVGLPVTRALAAQAQVIAYTTVPGAVASSTYTMKVNGEPVFVEKFGDVSIARFAFIGAANVELATSADVVNATISPRSYNLTPVVSGRTLKFSLAQPRKLIVQIDGIEKLLLFADGPERKPRAPGQAGVINLADYLAPDRDTAQPVTTQFQRAIDETAARNAGTGGVLYVPAGLYMTTQLRLKSNVELYLHSGARIRAVPVFNNTNYPVQNGADSSFIYIADVSNVKIAGRGVIDGNGFNLRSNTPGGGNNKLLRTKGARGVVLEDVYFRDSARWSLHFLYSDDVVTRGVKLVNDLRVTSGTLPFVTNTDGIDIDASTFVTVEDSFIYTTDDAITPKVTGYMGVKKQAHDIFVRNNVIWTQKCALKVGDEVLEDIYNVRFDNNDIVLADRFIALWNIGVDTIHNITANHNRTETIGVRDNKSFFYFYVRGNPGFVRDVEVNGLYALTRAPNESRMEGYDSTHRVSNFAVHNMFVSGVAMNSLANVPVVMRNDYVSNISLTPPGTDGLPLVQVTAADDYGVEGTDAGVFTFTRAGSLDAPLTAYFSLSGSATVNADYASPGGSVTFPAGAQQVSVSVMPLADADSENDETVLLTLVDRSQYRRDATSTVELTLAAGTSTGTTPPPTGDEPAVSILVEDGSASEAQTPVNGGRFRLIRTGSLTTPLTVNLSHAGSATNGSDYALLPAQFTIPAGSDRVQIFVLPKWDGVAEPHEKVITNVVTGSGYRIGTASATVTILNVNP